MKREPAKSFHDLIVRQKAHNFVCLIVLLLAALASCTKEPQLPMRIGTNVWPGYEPLYLARDLGYFNKTPVKLVEYTSLTESMRAFRNGTIDAAALTLDETLQLLATGTDLKVVLLMDVSNGADVILARPEIRSLKELKGRRVGYESTALGAYLLTRALQTAGMKPYDIKPVSLELSKHESGFRNARVDAIVTFEPVKTRLLAAGAIQIFDSSQIPGEIVDVLVVRKEFAKNNPKQVQEVLEGWFRALGYLKEKQQHAAEIMAVREKISAEEFLASLNGLSYPDLKENRFMLAAESPALLPAAERLVAVMLESGLLPKAPDIRTTFDDSYLKDIRP